MMVANGDFQLHPFIYVYKLKFSFPLFFIYYKNGLTDSYFIQLVIDHLCHNMFHIFITPIPIALKKSNLLLGVQYLLVVLFVFKLKTYLELLNIGLFFLPIQCLLLFIWGFPGGSANKESSCNVGNLDLIHALGRSP